MFTKDHGGHTHGASGPVVWASPDLGTLVRWNGSQTFNVFTFKGRAYENTHCFTSAYVSSQSDACRIAESVMCA